MPLSPEPEKEQQQEQEQEQNCPPKSQQEEEKPEEQSPLEPVIQNSTIDMKTYFQMKLGTPLVLIRY